MNKEATVIINGHAASASAENMMSGEVRVKGNASQSRRRLRPAAGCSSSRAMPRARCGISMKGVDIVVGGSVGHMSAFMAQAGNLVVCGDAGASLGDSIYEAKLYVQRQGREPRRRLHREGDDAEHHLAKLERLLTRAGHQGRSERFRRYGSARKLYNFHIDHADAY